MIKTALTSHSCDNLKKKVKGQEYKKRHGQGQQQMSAVKEAKGGRGRRKREGGKGRGGGWCKGGQGAAAQKGGSVYSLFLS